MSTLRWVGLDVHAETIAVAIAEGAGEPRDEGVIANRPEAIRKLMKRLGPPETVRVCYEAGVTGYALYWQLTRLGVRCEVIAPALVPVWPGDRVKTDRRDARKLVRSYRAGTLTPVWVPDPAHEALRDLVRAREAAKKDELRACHRVAKLLLRHGHYRPAGMKAWTLRHLAWIRAVRFAHPLDDVVRDDYLDEVEHVRARIHRLDQAITKAVQEAPAALREVVAALQALRGIAHLSAVTLVAEIGSFTRFARAPQLMGYAGMAPREHSSGTRTRRGGITKTGNAHLRRILVEAAWAARYRPGASRALRRRQAPLGAAVLEIAKRAQLRLHKRYGRLVARGKPKPQVSTAIGRELLGFVWAIGVHVERAQQAAAKPPAAA